MCYVLERCPLMLGCLPAFEVTCVAARSRGGQDTVWGQETILLSDCLVWVLRQSPNLIELGFHICNKKDVEQVAFLF